MSTGIIITLIIFGTGILLSVINTVNKALVRRDVIKKLNQFDNAFPMFKNTEKRNDNANDDLPKFGDF